MQYSLKAVGSLAKCLHPSRLAWEIEQLVEIHLIVEADVAYNHATVLGGNKKLLATTAIVSAMEYSYWTTSELTAVDCLVGIGGDLSKTIDERHNSHTVNIAQYRHAL